MTSALLLDRRTAGCSGCPGCSCRGARGLGAGEYVVIGQDTRWRVRGTTSPPFRFICNLEYDGWSIGTGTLVGPSTVLTAGHCVHRRQGGAEIPLVPGSMRIVPGRNGPSEPLPATRAVQFVPFPGYQRASPTDVALIHLANPIGTRVGWWGRLRGPTPADRYGTSLTALRPSGSGTLRVSLSGYPADLPQTPALGCRTPGGGPCAYSPLGSPGRSKTRCGTEQWQSRNVTVSLADPGLLLYVNDTCPGHSGSPVWQTRPPAAGGRHLVGVHVAASPGGASNRAVRLRPKVLEWIHGTTV
jgi:V8-like Glu-specific endopeptidase